MNGAERAAAAILVDTDVLIDASRQRADALASLEQIEARALASVSAVTRMELIVGCRNRADLRAVERFLRRFQIVEINEDISQAASDLLRRYRLSHGLLIADALIAATALTRTLPFVTANRRDFRFIPDLELLPYPNPFPSE